jgi:peptidoglycan/LPS O-acetylase OafA/YrhL
MCSAQSDPGWSADGGSTPAPRTGSWWSGRLDPRAPNAFSLLRFLAATLVVIGHTFPILGLPERGVLGDSFGAIAVDVFFVMSGFLITSAWERRTSLWQYARNRILRIVPGYAGVAAATVLVIGPAVTVFPLADYFRSEATWLYLRNATFTVMRFDLPGVFLANPLPVVVNGSLWTLPIEAAMYVAVAVLGAARLLHRRRLVLVLAGLAAVEILAQDFLVAHDVTLLGIMPVASVVDFGIYFALGALAWLWRDVLVLRADVAAGLLLTTWALPPSTLQRVFFMAAIPYATLFAARCPWTWATRFGQRRDLSYGLYLYAFPLQQCVVLVGGRDMPFALHLTLSWLLALGCAALSWRFIEQPALALKRRTARTRDRVAPVAARG